MSFDIARIAELGSLLARTAIASAESQVAALTEPELMDTLEEEATYVRLQHLENLIALVACSALSQLDYPKQDVFTEDALYCIGDRVQDGLRLWYQLDKFTTSPSV